ncbi:TPA: hypothetical protein U0431_001719 [Streptococcus suis]|nr:hypothetical protein [Streptococcus suis]HEM5208907.1 hypothetical protein [Streptococcus suis]
MKAVVLMKKELEHILLKLNEHLVKRHQKELANVVFDFYNQMSSSSWNSMVIRSEVKKFLQMIDTETFSLSIQLTSEERECLVRLREVSNPDKTNLAAYISL